MLKKLFFTTIVCLFLFASCSGLNKNTLVNPRGRDDVKSSSVINNKYKTVTFKYYRHYMGRVTEYSKKIVVPKDFVDTSDKSTYKEIKTVPLSRFVISFIYTKNVEAGIYDVIFLVQVTKNSKKDLEPVGLMTVNGNVKKYYIYNESGLPKKVEFDEMDKMMKKNLYKRTTESEKILI